jgi:hypothetical protein
MLGGLQLHQIAIDTIPVTSVDAECGFSSMNIICSDTRSSLAAERQSKLILSVLQALNCMTSAQHPELKNGCHQVIAHNQNSAI